MAAKKRIAVGYLRVSGKGQVNGTGLDRQRETIEDYAKKESVKLERFFKESYTGTEAERPEFTAMLEYLLGDGCRIIIVESLDRLARDLRVQLQLITALASKDITLINATTEQNVTAAMQEDPMIKAMVQIQGVFAELEKSLLVRKLRKARELKRKRAGRCEGRKPFGHYPGEQQVLRRMKQLYRKPRGGKRLGFYQIARILSEEGQPTRTGKGWSGPAVKGILTR